MNRILLSLAVTSIVATGCGRAALTSQAASPEAAERGASLPASKAVADDDATTAKTDGAPAITDGTLATTPAAGARKPGDFVVYRFSGSFRAAPLTLTQRVIDKRGSMLTIAVTTDDAGTKRELRVKIDEASATKNDVVSAAWIDGGVEKPTSVEAYEALLAGATLAADQNEAFLGTEDVTVDVGGAPVACTKASYRVRVGKKHATMRTFESASFAWGDVGGDITTASGKVLYQAEVVEIGHAEPAKAAVVAHSDYDL